MYDIMSMRDFLFLLLFWVIQERDYNCIKADVGTKMDSDDGS